MMSVMMFICTSLEEQIYTKKDYLSHNRCRFQFEADGTAQVEITDREAFAHHFILE